MANLSATLRAGSSGGDRDRKRGGGTLAGGLRADTPKLLGDQGYRLKHELDACVAWHRVLMSAHRSTAAAALRSCRKRQRERVEAL